MPEITKERIIELAMNVLGWTATGLAQVPDPEEGTFGEIDAGAMCDVLITAVALVIDNERGRFPNPRDVRLQCEEQGAKLHRLVKVLRNAGPSMSVLESAGRSVTPPAEGEVN